MKVFKIKPETVQKRREAILQWVIDTIEGDAEDKRIGKEHPWYHKVDKFLKGLENVGKRQFRVIWGMALTHWYEEFGSGDVGSDWDEFDNCWEQILQISII
jgi:hypothetical protein